MICPNCKKPLEDHPADRCLDIWAAELAGWKDIHKNEAGGWFGSQHFKDGWSVRIPYCHFSIEAAMGLLDSLPKSHDINLTRAMFVTNGAILWTCRITDLGILGMGASQSKEVAITRAYIAAKGAKDDE